MGNRIPRRHGAGLAALVTGALVTVLLSGGCAVRQGVAPLPPTPGRPTIAQDGAAGGAATEGAPTGTPVAGAPSLPGTPGTPTPSPAPVRYVFPVAGPATYARDHHDYPASDIMAACGTPVRAVADGVILEVSRTDRYSATVNDGATRGGLSVSLLGVDGVRYYGSHLSVVAAGIGAGVRVTAGQVLGKVGESGDASACHLHFGISPPCARTGDWWVRRGVLWPWSYLDAWRSGRSMSPVAAVRSWQAAHGCPASAPPGA